MKDIALALSSGGVRGQTHIGVIEELESQGYRTIKAIMEFVPDVPIEDLPIAYCAVATDWITSAGYRCKQHKPRHPHAPRTAHSREHSARP